MRTIRFNGEFWYEDRTPLLRRIAKWVAWFGGWEAHRGSGLGLRTRLRGDHLAPVSLFGHRVTYFGWGLQAKTPEGHLVIVWRGPDAGAVYISRDGTPQRAHVWFRGEPRAIREAVEQRERKRREEAAAWQARIAEIRAQAEADARKREAEFS